MTIIHDPIHGEIELSEMAMQIIDHPYFERTNYIYQTGTAYRVYPSATHTRKMHMIGTYSITRKLLENLSKTYPINEHTIELISIGALCHDLGHGPGSHVFDKHVVSKMVRDGCIDEEHPWIEHEKRSIYLFSEIVKDLKLPLTTEDVKFVNNVIEPQKGDKRWQFSIVNNNQHGIDTDKLDYILRDSYMMGLKVTINADALIKSSRILNEQWSFDSNISDVLREVVYVRYRIHRLLNESNVVKFDLSWRDVMTHGTMYEYLTEIFVNLDYEGFCNLTDGYIIHNGDSCLVKKFNERHTYEPISTTTDRHKHIVIKDEGDFSVENLKLTIKVCKTEGDCLAYIPFYDHKTGKQCVIPKTTVDSAYPSHEYIVHKYKNNSNHCSGCYPIFQPNQMAHVGPNGCLGDI
jgi:hypothetical protein